MKTVLLSLHPKWWTKMLTGEKVIEVRKSKPLDIEPNEKVKVIVYVTGNVGVVGGSSVISSIKSECCPLFS